ncbi:MAG: C-GCAxxG-C-C family protein [Clostridia bacterium]|nr:C-GCAxxG-C-C family protein [Clostridia bacterium]
MSELSRAENAKNYFYMGYNCTQAVVLAFSDLSGADKDTLLKMASSFGGGMGRLREVCGTVSGMFLVLGLLHGYSTPETGQIKANHYADVQELARRFEEKHGSIVCRELLGLKEKREDPIPEKRTPEYYKKRPCPELVYSATEILSEFLEEKYNIK